MKARRALLAGAVLMALAVALGAFGAHALKARLSVDALAIWQTAVQYHAWHALGLVALASWLERTPRRTALCLACWLLATGVALFSGSLYVLALTGWHTAGIVTPVGGALLIAGWCAAAWSAWRD